MKNVINILAAVILLAACTKTEVNYDSPSEIAFAPVAEGMTKAAVEGEMYLNGPGFNAFANTSDGVPYFANVSFVKGSETSGGLSVYVGNPTQYWPRTKSLLFAGYSGAMVVDDPNKDDDDIVFNGTSLSIDGYQQSADNDLMWFFTGPVNKSESIISPTMKHACSRITINVKGENACADWVITNMTLNSVNTSGDVTFTSEKAVWSSLGTGQDIELFKGESAIKVFKSVEAIVLPQSPATLTIGYNGKTTAPAIPLDYNGSSAWEAGKHYTYTLNFLNPYTIEFSVSGVTDWSGSQEIVMQ